MRPVGPGLRSLEMILWSETCSIRSMLEMLENAMKLRLVSKSNVGLFGARIGETSRNLCLHGRQVGIRLA